MISLFWMDKTVKCQTHLGLLLLIASRVQRTQESDLEAEEAPDLHQLKDDEHVNWKKMNERMYRSSPC